VYLNEKTCVCTQYIMNRHVEEVNMRIKKCLVSNQRKRTLHRNKVRLANRRHTQFASEQFNSETSSINTNNELNNR